MNLLALCFVALLISGFSIKAQDFNSNLICSSNDSRALKVFMSGMESAIDGWTLESPMCCNWFGITCHYNSNSNSSGVIVKLELSRRRLVGSLTNALVNLDQLRTLNLSHNLLRGPIPTALFHFPNLEVLDLSSNEFSGSLPWSMNLPSIQVFDFSYNDFEGSIPPSICTTNSTGIRVLRLGVNYFDGLIPPEFRSCNSLEYLSLDSNYLSGSIPEFLLQLPRLTHLDLKDNMFSGQINISETSNLVHLDLSLNSFSGNLPDVFRKFHNLSYFAARSNNFSGTIPPSLSNSQTISSLILRNNSFTSLANLNCSALINLDLLDLSNNKFSGLIPDNLPLCPKLRAVNLARNNFYGHIPESFKTFRTLSTLVLSMCRLENLTAYLDTLQHCPKLTTLSLTRSFRNEEMPSDAILEFKELKILVIPNCGLTGVIPTWLTRSTNLMLLDISWNRLSGPIPPSLGHLRSLFYIDLSNNSLTGEIPRTFTELPSLISSNTTSSEAFPSDFPIFMKQNMSRSGLQYNYLIRFPPTLDLSNNILTGPIWPEFGNLRRIHVLNLKHNNLSGKIPANFSQIASVETIDLSHNNLSGDIPIAMERLSSLSKFNVAYNKLTGKIPSGGQFSTFPSSSFEGNVGLCGDFFELLHCQTSEEFPQKRESKNNKGSIISMPVWIGFGAGFFLSVIFWFSIRPPCIKNVFSFLPI